MKRIRVLVGVALLLGIAAVALIRIDTDARAMLGSGAPAVQFLDTVEGLTTTVLLRHDDPAERATLVEDLAASLSANALVDRVLIPTDDDPQELLEFLWAYRYALAPPSDASLTTKAMAAELSDARAALTGLGSSTLAGRYLLDPTASFRRVVEHLEETASPQFFNSRKAAVIVFRQVQAPFDVRAQMGLAKSIDIAVNARGGTAALLGPRPISARISSHISQQSILVMLIGVALLLAWLAWTFRSISMVLLAFLPLAIGFTTATLVVQSVFGAVHVLAMGFGGALLGLALDYPIHLISHANTARSHATRCVKLGATTTAIAFGALIAAGLPALAQVGCFVATGLLASAAASVWLGPALKASRSLPLGNTLGFHLPGRQRCLTFILAASLVGLALLPERPVSTLAPPPADVLHDLAELGQVIDLPSGQHSIEVIGANLPDVLEAQARLRPHLARLVRADALGRARMLSDHLPAPPVQGQILTPETTTLHLREALTTAGLAPNFAGQIEAAYEEGIARAMVLPDNIPDTLNGLVKLGSDSLTAPIQLWQVADAAAAEDSIRKLDDPRIRFVDRQSWIAAGIAEIRSKVLTTLGAGLVLALAFLVFAKGRAAPAIAIGTATATALAALVVGTMFGGLGVFQIMALVLVVGIGIDYGLIVSNPGDESAGQDMRAASRGSVLLCAGSTIIAFGVMALSGVNVLVEIGATVVVGVVAMVLLALWRTERQA
ncbi:MAG: hypothetical protein AB8B85_17545 [Paracoccaceae bacterium]